MWINSSMVIALSVIAVALCLGTGPSQSREGRMESAGEGAAGISLPQSCDHQTKPSYQARFYAGERHREAMTTLAIFDSTERAQRTRGALAGFVEEKNAATAVLPRNDGRRLVLEGDHALLRYAAGEWDYGRTGDALRQIFAALRDSASTAADGEYLLYLALGRFGQVRFDGLGGDSRDSGAALSLTARIEKLTGPRSGMHLLLQAYLDSDTNSLPEYRNPADDKIAAGREMLRIATAAVNRRGAYTASAHLIRDLWRDGQKDEAVQTARALYPEAVARLEHMRAARLRGETELPTDCWADDLVVETINDILKDEYDRDEAVRAYTAEALETVLFGTLETDTFGASIHLSKLAALKTADDDAYRFLMANYKVLQGWETETSDLPAEISMALLAGGIFNDILAPALATDFYRDAALWLEQAPDINAAARLSAVGEIATFEWRSGNIAKFVPLLAQAKELLAEGAARPAASFFHAVAEYEDSQLNDEQVVDAIRQAHLAGDAADLLKEHLRGRLCDACGRKLTVLIGETLTEQEKTYKEHSDGFFAEPEFALLVLLSDSAAVDDELRSRVSDMVDRSERYRLWSQGMRTHRIAAKKLQPSEQRVLWLASEAVGYWREELGGEGLPDRDGPEVANLIAARMLLDPKLASKRVLAARIMDGISSFSSEFGGDSDQVVQFDNYSRLLQRAGYRLAARVVTENLARLAKSNPDVPEWSSWWGVPEEARVQRAEILGAAHARMARYAFEDGRWTDADAELGEAMSLMTLRLTREWQFGNERAVLLYRKMQSALRLSAQLRFLLALDENAAKAVPGLRDRTLEDLQFAMLGETALTMQSAARRRIYGSAEIAAAIERRDDAQDRLNQLDALENTIPSKLPWVIERRRQEARLTVEQATAMIDGNLSAPEELVALKSVDRATIEAALEPDEAVVILHSGGSNLYGYGIRPGHDPVLYVSKVGSSALSDMVARLRQDGASFGAIDLDNARLLYEHLLAPAVTILDGVSHLIVVGDGAVPAIPFAMLATGPTAAADTGASEAGAAAVRGAVPLQSRDPTEAGNVHAVPWLIRRYPVSVAPSIASIISQRNTPSSTVARKPFFGIGDPHLGGSISLASVEFSEIYTRGGQVDASVLASLAPLPETATELRNLAASLGASEAELLLGEAATRTNVLSAPLSQFKMLAFATHGVLAGEISGVSEPGLVLSPEHVSGGLVGGYLPLSDIMAMRLDADMVILSACNTGGADGRPRAEAMSGLARGFIAAGARQLMVTLWAIPSDPTTRLTTGTVTALQSHGEGSWPKAMRSSILMMIDNPVTAADRHPVSWAAFTILGVGGRDR